jgi:hypothetical protein
MGKWMNNFSFLAWALEEAEWPALTPVHFTPGKSAPSKSNNQHHKYMTAG